MIDYIKSDLKRYTGNPTFTAFLRNFFWNKGFNYSVWMRISSHSRFLKYIALPIHKIKKRGDIKIDYTTDIGYGLYIGHNGPVVINQTAKIGNNCNLSQFVSIGSSKGRSAYIGDNVYIGPNSCIVENVKIGNNVTIGAGSVVTKDIPDNATVAGNYAKVLNYDDPGVFVNNRH